MTAMKRVVIVGARLTCRARLVAAAIDGGAWLDSIQQALARLWSKVVPCAGQHRNDIQASGRLVNLPFSIPSCLIFDSSVDAGIPSLIAAPLGPVTFPRLFARAASISSFS